MPVPGGLDDGPQVRVLRIPSEDRSGLLRGRHELRRVAGSARALVGGDRVAGHVSRHVNDFLDREADTVAEVEDVVLAAPQEVVEGEDVGTREVADMDVVADTVPNIAMLFRFPFGTCRMSGMRWVSGSCASPMVPSGCAPQALK